MIGWSSTHLKHATPHLFSMDGLFLRGLTADPNVDYPRASAVFKGNLQNVTAAKKNE